MASTERIAIVGAGIIGCAIAFELSRRGKSVTVFEGRTAGGGATQASAGILAPYVEAHEGGPLFDLTVRGLAEYDAFVEHVRALSAKPFEYRRSGTLEIADDATRGRELRARLDAPWAASAGLRWLEAEQLHAAVPAARRDAAGALACPAHGYVAVAAFTDAIADAARTLGARFEFLTSVRTVNLAGAGVTVQTDHGGRAFDRVILCAGCWTPGIDPVGFTREAIEPIRGQLIRLSTTSPAADCVLWGRDCYIVPWQDGTVLVGATSEDVGFDERATAEGVRGLLAAAEQLVPALRDATFLEVRVGLRPATINGLPILGPSADPRVLYAAGHFRNGILLAPLTARLVADLL